MGLKERNKGRNQTGNATAVAEPELEAEQIEMEAAEDANADAGTDAGTDTEPGRRRGRKPGQSQNRGPQLEWTYDRQIALIRILKSPKAPGTIRTAQSVADALAQDPAFWGETLLNADRVKSFIARAVKELETAGRPVPEYLTLDRARRVVVNLALFDTEDEAEGVMEGEGETEEEAAE